MVANIAIEKLRQPPKCYWLGRCPEARPCGKCREV